jgi:hypothetical protein
MIFTNERNEMIKVRKKGDTLPVTNNTLNSAWVVRVVVVRGDRAADAGDKRGPADKVEQLIGKDASHGPTYHA